MNVAAIEPASAFFGAPEAALGFVAVALVAVAMSFAARQRQRRLLAVVGPRAERLAVERSASSTTNRARLAIVGLAFGVLALMQPRFGAGATSASPLTADLCLCLDVSRSMLAKDLQPTRLAFAESAIVELGQRLRGDRVALVEFAGEARLRVPLTRDVASMLEIVRGVDPSDVALGGTDLARAIDTGVLALAAANKSAPDSQLQGALLLVTDGEDPTGAGRAAAERARSRGLTVHCVGIGSPLGSKITVTGSDGRETFLRDRNGNDVLTRLDAASLRALATAGGGIYVDAQSTASPLVAAYERGVLPTLRARATQSEVESAERADHFQLPLSIAVLLAFLDLLLPQRRRVRARAPGGGAS